MDTQNLVSQLDGRRFSALDVRHGATIDQDTLTNILNKTEPPLELCSEAPGRGRRRHYCLIDVYQIALHARLVAITKDAAWSSRSLNALLFGTEWIEGEAPAPGMEALKDSHCEAIRGADALYWHRDLTDPYFLAAPLLRTQPARLGKLESFRGRIDPSFPMGVLLNVTAYLHGVDQVLAESETIGGTGDE
jgi:hypothetical protein